MPRVCNLTPDGRHRGWEKGRATVAAVVDARRGKARGLAAAGWPTWRIMAELGLSKSTVCRYLRGG